MYSTRLKRRILKTSANKFVFLTVWLYVGQIHARGKKWERKKRFFLVNQTLELNRFYYTESSNLRPVRSHSDVWRTKKGVSIYTQSLSSAKISGTTTNRTGGNCCQLFQFQFQKTLFIMIIVLQIRVLTFNPLFSGTILEEK